VNDGLLLQWQSYHNVHLIYLKGELARSEATCNQQLIQLDESASEIEALRTELQQVASFVFPPFTIQSFVYNCSFSIHMCHSLQKTNELVEKASQLAIQSGMCNFKGFVTLKYIFVYNLGEFETFRTVLSQLEKQHAESEVPSSIFYVSVLLRYIVLVI
jgi:hypothetical protein